MPTTSTPILSHLRQQSLTARQAVAQRVDRYLNIAEARRKGRRFPLEPRESAHLKSPLGRQYSLLGLRAPYVPVRRKKNTSRGTKLASSHRRDLSKPTEATPPPAALTLPKVPAVVPEELVRLARERRLTEQQHAPQIRIWLQMAGINEREIDARTRLILDSLDRPGAEAAPAKLYDVGRQFVARDIGLSVPQTKQLGRLVITELTNDSARKSDGMSPVETFLSQLLRPLNVAQGKC